MSKTLPDRRSFEPRRLRLIASRGQFIDEREPPLRIGDIVALNSGGPLSLVVDVPNCKTVTISWLTAPYAYAACEGTFPIECVHRIRLVG